MSAPIPVLSERNRMREFEFRDEDFQALRALIKDLTGIHLADTKRELVYGRISRRLRVLGLNDFGDYRRRLALVEEELVEFCNAMTTNLTAFFREPHHFEYLRKEFLEPRLRDANASRRIRIWSTACSSGEEPYSLAITLAETLGNLDRWDVKILATDIDSNILESARQGAYTEERVRGLSPALIARYFSASSDAGRRFYSVAPELANLITFKPLNLMRRLPMKGPLDVIVCRNVIIYFDKETQRDLFARIATLQRPGDLLILGHSESLFKVSNDYSLIGRTIYRRI